MSIQTLRTHTLPDECPPEHRGHRLSQTNVYLNTEDTDPPGRIPTRTPRTQVLLDECSPYH
ncbi:hypothetical protein DPMN_137892 [Dreissena polymorpha]|uniref:Uncharacterized protein n=1 Tax=Dreissena polymorpha TaxID=45954 RepID=A0A9D4G5K2_DREPO|nr:hypothetical protein DPMN_137892 [Dreissena polymorpha]